MRIRDGILRRGLAPLVLLALLALVPAAAGAATIVINNVDGPGEGFNDPTPVAPVGGNPGTTLGQQRLNVFQYAANLWGAILPSAVTIQVNAAFNPLTCTSTSAVLGSAGPSFVFRDFAGAVFPGTWYHSALADKLAGLELGGIPDLNSQFNSNLNGSPGCLGGASWYYGYDFNEGSNVDLLPVVLHELGHGLGFSTLTNGATGQYFNSFPSTFDHFLTDLSTGLTWNAASQAQRAASAISVTGLGWSGWDGKAAAGAYLSKRARVLVNSPPGIAGNTFGNAALFGAPLTSPGVTADIVLVNDGVGTTSDGCEAIVNSVAGKIALIDRGTCAFVLKAANAQAAGAVGVIIANNVAGEFVPGGTDPSIVIPVIGVTQAFGNTLKAELLNGPVNATLGLHPTQLAGTDPTGRPLMYAPNPFQSGSSVSHWDVSMTPNTLMEPAINTDLTGVDITTGAFRDIGWLPTLASAPAPGGTGRVAFTGAPRPNPATSGTAIGFRLPGPEFVRLAVYDVRGARVATLENRMLPPGDHVARWDGRTAGGLEAAPGVYLVALTTSQGTLTQRVSVLR